MELKINRGGNVMLWYHVKSPQRIFCSYYKRVSAFSLACMTHSLTLENCVFFYLLSRPHRIEIPNGYAMSIVECYSSTKIIVRRHNIHPKHVSGSRANWKIDCGKAILCSSSTTCSICINAWARRASNCKFIKKILIANKNVFIISIRSFFSLQKKKKDLPTEMFIFIGRFQCDYCCVFGKERWEEWKGIEWKGEKSVVRELISISLWEVNWVRGYNHDLKIWT